MNLKDFVDAIEKAASKYFYKLRILVKTDNAVKARIDISDNIYVQFYFHQISGTTNYVLVVWDNRLYGRDCIEGTWHRHPFENPDEHDFQGDGSKNIMPEEFLDDVFEILLKEKLL